MAYDAAEVGSLRFLAGNVMFQLTRKMMDSDNGGDIDALEDATFLMDIITSHYTENDKDFLTEWEEIQTEKEAEVSDGYVPGIHRDADADFRQREIKAMFRSLCRKGVFVYQEPEGTDWNVKT